MAEHAELAAFAADQQQHRQIGEQRDDADHAHRVRIQRQCQRRGFRLHAQRHADQQPGTEHEAERAHQHHLADLRQVQAGTGEQRLGGLRAQPALHRDAGFRIILGGQEAPAVSCTISAAGAPLRAASSNL
ncbi:hypothetical protein G6F24_017199 [Rhizopus arrhizus]|nr:hypothetical protein G6F24_017199 [Rhizopus arrhizus]